MINHVLSKLLKIKILKGQAIKPIKQLSTRAHHTSVWDVDQGVVADSIHNKRVYSLSKAELGTLDLIWKIVYFVTYMKAVVICRLKTFSMLLTLGKMSGGGDDNAARYGEVFSVLKKGNEINLV